MVKVRGFRIDMAEIEVALRDVEGIEDAVVEPREDHAGDRKVVAYMVHGTSPDSTVSRLRRDLVRVLPDYMIPSAFVSMDALPKTPNGKTDRRSLPAPPRQRPDLDVPFGPPVRPLEAALAKIWAEGLELDQVRLHDDFLELGGNSLIATRLSTRVRTLGRGARRHRRVRRADGGEADHPLGSRLAGTCDIALISASARRDRRPRFPAARVGW